jgi:hypothetical protein
MSDRGEPRIDLGVIVAEFTAIDDATALESLARWLKQQDHQRDLLAVTIEHDWSDQYTPTRITAHVVVNRG